MIDLTKEDLARVYALATERLQIIATELYEDLFDGNGDPKVHPGQVTNLVSSFRMKALLEMDMIREAVVQYSEHHHLNGQPQQTSIFDDHRKGR